MRLAIIIIGFLLSSCQKKSELVQQFLDLDGFLIVEETISIGEDIKIIAGIDDVEMDGEACILFTSSLIDKIYCIELVSSRGEFIIPKELNVQSGIVSLDLFVGGECIARHISYISAGTPNNVMEGFIGAKTLITDDEDPAMLVVIPIDTFNNFCEDSTQVIINSIDTRKAERTFTKSTIQGLTYQLYDGLKTTAKTSIGATSSGAFMMEKELKHVPGEPVFFNLRTSNVYPYADGRQTFDVFSSTIRDLHGNIVADGTIIDYVVNDGTGISKYRSITTNGISNLLLRNPNEEVDLVVYAEVDGVRKSRDIQVSFKPYILNYTVKYNSKNKKISIGPISGSLGQIIPDGTEVLITIKNKNLSKTSKRQTLEGRIIIELDKFSLDSGEYEVEVDISSNKKSLQVSI